MASLGQLAGNALDYLGTAFKLPEYGLSERLAGGNPTTFTGYTPQSQAKGLDTWRQTMFNQGTGSTKQQSSGTQNPGGGSALGAQNSLSQVPNNPTDPYQDTRNASQDDYNAQVSRLNSQYDYLADQTRGQLSSLEAQRGNSLASLNTELEGVRSQVGRSKEASKANTEDNIRQAGDVARQTQLRNRNTLRALGILSSSAAGDILARPLEAFDQERARIVQLGTQRMNELDDFMNQKTSEHSNAVQQLESQYTELVGNIQRDLRFNERQRADAIESANSALSSRLAEIKQAQFNYENAVKAQKANWAMQLAQMNSYQLPQAQVNQILSQVFSPQQGTTPMTVGVYGDDQRKRLSDY